MPDLTQAAPRATTYHALAGYARLSKNPDGTLLSVARQIEAGNQHAKANGNTITAWFADDDLSAWDETVIRPGWEDYLKALDSGQHDGAMTYHLDRLSRNGRDSERLLAVTKARNLPLITPQQVFELGSNDDARMIFRVMSAVAINQSDSTARRIKFHKDAARAEGNLRTVLGGTPPVGYQDGEADWRVEPTAAAMLCDVAARVLRGEALSDAYAAQPVTLDAKGQPITEKQLRAALQRPATAGLMTARDGTEIGQVIDDPPLPLPTWRAVRAVFTARKRGRATTTSYPFGKLLRCGKCGNQLTGAPIYDRRNGKVVKATPAYRCKNPHPKLGITKPCNGVSVSAEQVHDMLKAAAEGWAAGSPAWAAVSARLPDLTARQGELGAQISQIQEWIADAQDNRNRGLTSPARYEQAKAELAAQISQAQAELAAVATVMAQPVPAALEWDAMTRAEQRWLIAEAFETPLKVAPGNGGGRALTAIERIPMTLRGAAAKG